MTDTLSHIPSNSKQDEQDKADFRVIMAMKNYATLEEVKARVMHALTAITAKFFVPVHHERRWKRQERCKQVDASMAMREEPEKGQTHCGTKPGQFETSYHSLPHK